MIRLGDSLLWIEPKPDGWWLLVVEEAKKDRATRQLTRRTTRRFGPFTSIEHILQQRQVKLDDDAKSELNEMVEIGKASEAAVDEMPSS